MHLVIGYLNFYSSATTVSFFLSFFGSWGYNLAFLTDK